MTTQTVEKRIVAADKKKKYIPYSVVKELYDECSVQRFDELHSFFYTWYWLSSVLSILLTTISGATSAPNLVRDSDKDSFFHDTLSLVGLVTGILSAFLISIEKVADVQRVADNCKYARGELAHVLASKDDIPEKIFVRITNTDLMWFKHPRKCEAYSAEELRRKMIR